MKLEVVFGSILRELRLERNLSQVELSVRSGIDRTFISLLERGVRQPTLKSLFQLSSALSLDPSDILILVQKDVRRTRWKRLRS